MQKRHNNPQQYFEEQITTTEQFVIPYIEQIMPISNQLRVLEIGCGLAGNMVPFLKRKCEVVGIDINPYSIEKAKELMQSYGIKNMPQFLTEDIYKVDLDKIGKFDLIILRDVIEHIPNQKKFLGFVKNFLAPRGKIFFAFPPWRMPFGGHQQICKNRLLSVLPFFHLLPGFLYPLFLKIFGESQGTIQELKEIKQTGISIARFESIVKRENYTFDKKTYYLINPNYKTKFGLTPKQLPRIIGAVPYVKDFFTTCMYCVVGYNT